MISYQQTVNSNLDFYSTIMFVMAFLCLLLSVSFIVMIKMFSISTSQESIYYIYILENVHIDKQLSLLYKFYTTFFSRFLVEKNTAVIQIFNPNYFNDEDSVKTNKPTSVSKISENKEDEGSDKGKAQVKLKDEINSETRLRTKFYTSGDKKSFLKFKRKYFIKFLIETSFISILVSSLIIILMLSIFFAFQRKIIQIGRNETDLILASTSYLTEIYQVNVAAQEIVYKTYDNNKYLYLVYENQRMQAIENFYKFLNFNNEQNIPWFSSYYNYINEKLQFDYTDAYLTDTNIPIYESSFRYIIGTSFKTMFTSTLSLTDYFLIINKRNITTLGYLKEIDNVRLDILTVIEYEMEAIMNKIRDTSQNVDETFTLVIIIILILFVLVSGVLFYLNFISLKKRMTEDSYVTKNLVNLVPYKFAKASKNIKNFMASNKST